MEICVWDSSMLVMIEAGSEAATKLIRDHVWQNSRAGTTLACIDDEGKVLGVGGIRLDLENTWYAWAWIHPSLRKQFPIWMGKTMFRNLWELVKKREVKRLVAYSERGFAEGNRWLMRLGFQPFALYHFYDFRREDHIWYEWVNQDGV